MPLPHFLSEIRLADVVAIGGFRMRAAGADDYAGFNFGSADINGDGLSDLIVCADGYEGGGLFAGGAYVIYGRQGGPASLIDFANLTQADGFVIQGEFAYDLASRSVSGAGDVNGDGIADMFIGAFKNDEGGHDSGAAYIIYGRADPFPGVIDLYDLPGDMGVKIVGEAEEDYASFWVASAGDVNGDGRDDLIMGAPQNDAGGSNAGAAYVIFGRDSAFAGKIVLADLRPADGFKITGAGALDVAGLAVGSAGDVNGDGFADLLVGAPQNDGTGSGLGYVLYGGTAIGATDLAQLTEAQGFILRGEAGGDRAGYTIAGAGDVNGDGLDDIVIGAIGQDAGGPASGAAYVVFGSRSAFGATLDLAELDGTNGFKLQGAAPGDDTGVCVSTAGDVNGDGYDDLLIGAQSSAIDGPRSGVAYLLFGHAGGFAPVVDLARLDPHDGARIRGEGAHDGTGRALAAAGDMNGDGYDDIVIGSPWNGAAGWEAGAAYVVYGRPDNQAPVAIASRVFATEDVAYTFAVADFGFSDADGGVLAAVQIETLPSRGTLLLRGSALAAGQTVSVADIAAGGLVFQAESKASGIDYASLTFRVRDDGGTVAGGQDVSNLATLNIQVAADPTNGEDLVYGTSGNDTLASGDGRARLFGLSGDDIFLVGNQDHVAVEAAGGGTDTVRTSISYALASGSEIEILEATDPTGTTALRLWGNEFGNTLRGNAGTNTLIGNGGGDVLEGRAGDDGYLVYAGDIVIEAAGGGNDTVYAVGNYALNAGAAVEVLLCYDRDATIAQNLTGNEADTIIMGNRGDNVIIGGGGRDTMYGYRGNDTFYVDSLDDLPVELAGEGYDTIVASASYIMPQGMEFEVLRAIDPNATAAINLTGNKIPNLIIGNAGANILDGLGGGDDMRGLGGDDTYVVRRANDRVEEAADGGNDTVLALVDYVLADGTSIERLEAYDLLGTIALRLTGNAIANVVRGNAGGNRLEGGGGDDVLIGLGGADRLDGGTGIDTASYAGSAIGVTVDLQLGTATGGDAQGDMIVGIENLTGSSSADALTGDTGGNRLEGSGGDDVLTGLGGADRLDGGTGVDTASYAGSAIGVSVNLQLGTATGGDAQGDTFVGIENLLGSLQADILTGDDGDNAIDGSGGNDTLTGNGGNDRLNGGTGRDIMTGGAGDDTYLVDDAGDLVIDASGGADAVETTLAAYTLGNGIEILRFTGTGAFAGTGNTVANIIVGGAGADTLDGGTGADQLHGGGSDDLYRVDNAGDQVFEATGAGFDTVIATASWVLGAGQSVERLVARAGSAAIALTGNELAQELVGNDGANVLNGGGGADVLRGGLGNDTYHVDDAGDIVDEGADAGTDTVIASLDWALGGNLENLILAGTTGLTGIGNDLANRMTGSGGGDRLYGGVGIDTLDGGAGGDMLYGGSEDDRAYGGAGFDLLYGGDGVDLLDGGEGDDAVYGGEGGDRITGGAGLDALWGEGGNDQLDGGDDGDQLDGAGGDDRLYGGGGADTLAGGQGNDTLDGGIGDDAMAGGTGNDTYLVDSVGDTVVEQADEGIDQVRTTLAVYTLGANLERLIFIGTGAFAGTGNAAANVINGDAGTDTLDGADGNDTINGGIGNDVLIGGSGTDILAGGTGDDRFVFASMADFGPSGRPDTIVDYANRSGDDDVIDLSGIGGLSFIGTAAFTGVGVGQVRWAQRVDHAEVLIDFDGNGTTDASIRLTGTIALDASDILL